MATEGDAAALTASSINQEQLLHELEAKYLALKSEFTLAENDRQALVADKAAALAEVERKTKLAAERNEEANQLKQQMLQLTMEKDSLSFKLQMAASLAERRLSETEELQSTVREQNRLLVDVQRQEMQSLERASQQEAQVAPLTNALSRAKKETEVAQQHSQWLESQLSEKTKIIQELRLTLASLTHELEELKIRSAEELASTKRQLESARLANQKMENALIKSKEALKELQASKVHDEEALQNELNAQRRLATLYQESADHATARVSELQRLCDSLRKSLDDSEKALIRETERTKEHVEHLFREQAETSEARIQALQDDLQNAEQRIEELEQKKMLTLQTTSAIAELSTAAGEAHLAAHGLTPKQMFDHIVELEETLQAERKEKEKLQIYMDRIVKEVQEKAPVLMALRLDHERTVASHTQLSERLEHCMHELVKSKHNEQQAWNEKSALEKKCESFAQSMDDLSRQVQHLLFRSQKEHQQVDNLEVGSENLVIFKNVEELQVRNQQLLAVIRELTEMNKSKLDNKSSNGSDLESTETSAHLITTGDSDEEVTENGIPGAIQKRLSEARRELQELRLEREQEREMITAIVKQRDMYRILLAQSDTKFFDGNDSSSTKVGSFFVEKAPSNRNSLDLNESTKVREIQMEFEDYKKEKQASLRMLQENLDQEHNKNSQLRLAQMQAQVEATCSKERYEASEERCTNAENELVRLRSKADQLSSSILQHQSMLANVEAKLETANSRLQSLSVEKDSAVCEATYLRKNEEKLLQEMTTLRLDNTNLLKLMESTRRMETGREERDHRAIETLTKKVTLLETKLQETYEKLDTKEALSGAQALAAEREKQAALTELQKLKERHGQLKEQLVRLEEQKTALESKSTLLEQETTHLREQLRKGANTSVNERVATLEVQLRDAQHELQTLLVSKKTLAESVIKYKALAEANDKTLIELSSASEKWKRSEAEKVLALENSRNSLGAELDKARAELAEQTAKNHALREEINRDEQTRKRAISEAIEKQTMLQLQLDNAVQQLNSVREEMGKMKRVLDTTQDNYERELQLHAAEVAKSSSSRREMEELRKVVCEQEATIKSLNIKVQSVRKELNLELETLQKHLDDAVEAKNVVLEQNKLLHSQLERAATQVRRAHEQELLNVSGSQQDAGEAVVAFNAHDKEIDDLRSVVAYLRKTSEIAESKLEISQQEVQRSRAQIFSLESTIIRLREEVKFLSDAATAASQQATVSSADDEKRVAQIEQLSLLRESNATLRDENQKNLARFKEAEAKVRNLEAKIVPLQNAETSLKIQVASLKQEVETLNDANKRWKQRVDQLVEKYQQIDPADHEKLLLEKEAMTEELAKIKTGQSALKAELETLRSRGGKELEEEKKKVENWMKQYERIKGFAKNWKNKAEALTKQLAEKNKEVEDRTSVVAMLEAKLISVQTQISTVTTEKSALEMKLATCEVARQESVAAASGVSASWEKERQALKAQLEIETKKSTQLKDFNARLMSGLKTLKKENSELKDNAANASQSSVPQDKTPLLSPPGSPPQISSQATSTAPTKPAPALSKPSAAPALLFSSPKPGAQTEPVVSQSSAVTTEANKSVAPIAAQGTISVASAASSSPQCLPISTVISTVNTATSTANATTAPALSIYQPTVKPVVISPAQAATEIAPTSALSVPVPPVVVPTKVETESSNHESAMTSEEQLRQYALRSIKKQVGGATRSTSTKDLVPSASAVTVVSPAITETVTVSETPEHLEFSAGTSFGAFGSGGPSGLVFGKPGISLPIPSATSPAASNPPHLSLTGESVPPEAMRRSQRLARFSASGDATTSASIPLVPGSSSTKRPLNDAEEGATSMPKVAKTSDNQTTKTTPASTTMSVANNTISEGREEDDDPSQTETTESQSTPQPQ
ncbi:nuclear mitotic apparatus [Plasmopara halstedii]|uniref:Nuclear mitotic apparatus n=1 Tax=Plasmopara halstedii TaxID=4781 RepID=A0A0P1AB92_PLAHL|nr:nuclear mitotic apparatus [Plasmopara halstedii]CEG37874.1 nuclear mitotic apparatus [Plasmopara halstedii]|eukprot:XP_024574243.1 nuclear mitotic apparatus [Plasmopara halstedii]